MAVCDNGTKSNTVLADLVNIVNNGTTANQAHVLMMPYPGQGHINPLMSLARKLASRGVTITFINSLFPHNCQMKAHKEASTVVDKIILGHDVMPNNVISRTKDENRNNGAGSHVYEVCALRRAHKQHGEIRMMGIPDGLSPSDHILHDVGKNCEAITNYIPDQLLAIVKHIRPPITCLVTDVLVHVCTEAVAASLSVPHVGFWMQSAASYATHAIFTRDHAKLKGLMSEDSGDTLITAIPGAPALKPSEIYTFLQPCDPSDFIFSYIMRCFESALRCSHILLNTFDALEAESLEFLHSTRPCNMLTVGPVLPPLYFKDVSGAADSHSLADAKLEASSMWEENDGCLAWLDGQNLRSVLYVSFGSITLISAQQMEVLATALAASGYPILIVAREINIEGKEVVLPESFMRLNGGIVMVVKWAPQLKVLAHPAIGAFLSHCGWNSTLEAISKGVPILCWPIFADQIANSRAIVDSWGVGLEFQKDKSSSLVIREEIETKVKYIMDPSSSKELRERARKLSNMATEAYDGYSKDNLNLFTQFLLK